MFISRQALLKLIATMALCMSSYVSTAETFEADWNFKVLLNDKPIGFHNFSLTGDGERQTLTTEAKFDVKFLFINAFSYRHDSTETWSNGCLDSIDATTDNNGDYLTVRGQRYENALQVTSRVGEQQLNQCVQSFAYWNPDVLDSSQLLNSQTGELEDVDVTMESLDAVDVNGETIDAIRYRLNAKAGAVTLWYTNDESRRWLALEAPAKGGRTIRYIPTEVPAAEDLSAPARAANANSTVETRENRT